MPSLTEGLNGLEKALGDKGIQVVSLGVPSHGLGYGDLESQGQQEKQAKPVPQFRQGLHA